MNSKSLYLMLTLLLTILFRTAEATSLEADDSDNPFDCDTNPTPEEVLAMEAKFQAGLKAHGHRLRARDEGPLVLNIYWHVVSASEKESDGNLPGDIIKNQINILNAHTRQLGFQWKLAKLDRTVNAKWFREIVKKRGTEERKMVDRLRYTDSTAKDLNIYSFDIPNVVRKKVTKLRNGYSTFPSDYEKAGYRDGVFLHWRTLPDTVHTRDGHLGYSATGLDCTTPLKMGVTNLVIMSMTHLTKPRPHLVAQREETPALNTPVSIPSVSFQVSQAAMCQGKAMNLFADNFMDYSSCRNHFTPGQAVRARQEFTVFREDSDSEPEPERPSSSHQAHLHARDLGWHGTSEGLARHLLRMYMKDIEDVIYDDFGQEVPGFHAQ
ncbi:hypothetical protein H0H92_007522 [Tricholoma furcatifolium]|nr:hypothetical protein H0H92_007522 [Tricholoma furcatifolium]